MATGAAEAEFYPTTRTQRYPRHLGVDFRKLPHATLLKYIKTYGVHVRADCTPSELQVAVGRHFEANLDADDEECIARFMAAAKRATAPADTAKRGSMAARLGDAHATTPLPKKRRRTQAAKKVENPILEDEPDEPDEPEEDGPPLYCLCKRPDYGEMIACDNEECEIEWFHLGCVGLIPSTRPGDNEKWYCPDCRSPESPQLGGRKKPKGKASQRKRKTGNARRR